MKKIIYCLGNEVVDIDSLPLKMMPYLSKKFPQINFLPFDPTESTETENKMIFLDTVFGIKKIKLITDLKNLRLSPRNSVHDYDLPLYLGLMLKLKKIKEFTVIGLPVNYPLKNAFKEVSPYIKDI